MLGTAYGAGIHESVHPCTASRCGGGELAFALALALASAAGCRPKRGPLRRGEGA
jgi:hypothetical protein